MGCDFYSYCPRCKEHTLANWYSIGFPDEGEGKVSPHFEVAYRCECRECGFQYEFTHLIENAGWDRIDTDLKPLISDPPGIDQEQVSSFWDRLTGGWSGEPVESEYQLYPDGAEYDEEDHEYYAYNDPRDLPAPDPATERIKELLRDYPQSDLEPPKRESSVPGALLEVAPPETLQRAFNGVPKEALDLDFLDSLGADLK